MFNSVLRNVPPLFQYFFLEIKPSKRNHFDNFKRKNSFFESDNRFYSYFLTIYSLSLSCLFSFRWQYFAVVCKCRTLFPTRAHTRLNQQKGVLSVRNKTVTIPPPPPLCRLRRPPPSSPRIFTVLFTFSSTKLRREVPTSPRPDKKKT